MGLYLMFGKYNPGSLQKISHERTEEASNLIQRNGGTLKSGYAMLGESDLLFIVDFPDTSNVLKTSVEMGNRFGISFTSMPAVTVDAFDQLVK